MGFKSAWIACNGKSLRRLAGDLGLRPTRARDAAGDAEYCGLDRPGGWGIVLDNFAAGELLTERALGKAMSGCEGFVCYADDTTMMSMATGFRDGAETWCVTHDSAVSSTHLEIEGEPPAPFVALRTEAMARATASDGTNNLYDIPAAMSAALTGFRHDASPPAPFTVLRRKLLGLF